MAAGTLIAITEGYDSRTPQKQFKRGKMLKITRTANGEVVFMVSGRLDAENVAELKALFSSEGSSRRMILDLKELTLVDQDAVSFLASCEANGIELKNCTAYIREWIAKEEGPPSRGK